MTRRMICIRTQPRARVFSLKGMSAHTPFSPSLSLSLCLSLPPSRTSSHEINLTIALPRIDASERMAPMWRAYVDVLIVRLTGIAFTEQ